jgi:hypothetical protein
MVCTATALSFTLLVQGSVEFNKNAKVKAVPSICIKVSFVSVRKNNTKIPVKNWNSFHKIFDIMISKSEIYFLKHFTEEINFSFYRYFVNNSNYKAFFYICRFLSLSHCLPLQRGNDQQQCSPIPPHLILTSFSVSLRHNLLTFSSENCKTTGRRRICQTKKGLYCCCSTIHFT